MSHIVHLFKIFSPWSIYLLYSMSWLDSKCKLIWRLCVEFESFLRIEPAAIHFEVDWLLWFILSNVSLYPQLQTEVFRCHYCVTICITWSDLDKYYTCILYNRTSIRYSVIILQCMFIQLVFQCWLHHMVIIITWTGYDIDQNDRRLISRHTRLYLNQCHNIWP